MIRIYAAKTEGLTRAELLPHIRLDVGENKQTAWNRMPEEKAVGSLTGILLLQHALEQMGISPEGHSMEYALYGRPSLLLPQVDFNISHTDGLTVCAVEFEPNSHSPRIAIDAECANGRTGKSMKRIVSGWFSKQEKELFSKEPTEECFLKLWTAKEALTKWTGDGLSALCRCDSTQPPAGCSLTVYTLQNTTVTLCHRTDTLPPDMLVFPFSDEIGAR